MKTISNRETQVNLKSHTLNIDIMLLTLNLFLFSIVGTFGLVSNEFYLQTSKYLIIFIFVSITLNSIISKEQDYTFLFFFLSFGFFILSRFFIDIINYKPYFHANLYTDFYFSKAIQSKTQTLIIIVLISINIGYVYGKNIIGNRIKKIDDIKYNKIMVTIGITLMIFSFPFVLTKLYIQIIYISKYGYLSLFTGIYKDINYPIWTIGSLTIFQMGYYAIILGRPPKKIFIIFSALYFVYIFFESIKGQRGPLIINTLLITWLYTNIYNAKLKIKYLFFLMLSLLIFSQFIGQIRSKDKAKNNYSLVNEFFYSQGITLILSMHILNNENEFINHSYPYILAPVMDYFNKYLHRTIYQKGQSSELIKYSNDINTQLTFFLDSNRYLKGNGIGSCYLIELYDLGKYFGIIVGNIILVCLMFILSKKALKNRINFLFSILVFRSFVYMPRNRILSFFPDLFKTSLILFFISIITIIILYNNIKSFKKPNIEKIF